MAASIVTPMDVGGALPWAYGITFSATSYALGVAGQYAQAYKRMRVVYATRAQAPNTFRVICGTDNGAGGGLSLATESKASGSYSMGNVPFFDGRYSTAIDAAPSSAARAQMIQLPAQIGKYVIRDACLDTTGLRVWDYLDGYAINAGVVSAETSWTSAAQFAVNTRPGAAPPSLSYGDLTIVEIQFSTTYATAAQVLADASLPIGTAIAGGAGSTHWVAGDVLSGTSWADRLGGKVLTLGGSPLLRQPVYQRPAGIGTFVWFGDSHTLRQEGPLDGDGPRRACLSAVLDAGYTCTENGQYGPAADTTKDFDPYHFGLSGQALGVINGGVPTRLSTIDADLDAYCPPNAGAIIVFAYGANDVFRRATNGESATDIRDHFLADLDAGIAAVVAHCGSDVPIVVADCTRISDAIDVPNEQAGIEAIYTALPAYVAAKQATVPRTRLCSWHDIATPTQASANDTGNAYDGRHFVAATRAAMGRGLAAAAIAARTGA